MNILESTLYTNFSDGVNYMQLIFALSLKLIYEWVHTMSLLLWLAYLIQDGFFKFYLFSCEFQDSIFSSPAE